MALILCPACRTLLREAGGPTWRRCLTCSGVVVPPVALVLDTFFDLDDAEGRG